MSGADRRDLDDKRETIEPSLHSLNVSISWCFSLLATRFPSATYPLREIGSSSPPTLFGLDCLCIAHGRGKKEQNEEGCFIFYGHLGEGGGDRREKKRTAEKMLRSEQEI